MTDSLMKFLHDNIVISTYYMIAFKYSTHNTSPLVYYCVVSRLSPCFRDGLPSTLNLRGTKNSGFRKNDTFCMIFKNPKYYCYEHINTNVKLGSDPPPAKPAVPYSPHLDHDPGTCHHPGTDHTANSPQYSLTPG